MVTDHPMTTRPQETRAMTGRESNPPDSRRGNTDEGTNNREARDPRGREAPAVSHESIRDFRGHPTDFLVDILDQESEVIIVAELPGADVETIKLNLLNPQTLRITARRAEPVEEGSGGYYIRERGNGIMSRLIRLPASVTDESARTSFKNGVLEVRLQKMRGAPERGGKRITIE